LTSIVLARRYARALFSLGKELGELDAIREKVVALDAFFRENPEIEQALSNPIYPSDVKKTVTEEIVKAFKMSGPLETFLGLLVERRRVHYFHQIIDVFQELVDEDKGVVKAIVRTAVPLTVDLSEKVKELLAKVAGRQVVVQVKEDPEIIGGIIVRIGDTVWDGSIRSQLQALKQSIERGEAR